MLLQRVFRLKRFMQNAHKLPQRQSGTFVYRTPPHKAPKINYVAAEAIGGLAWWWILWHFWHEHELVFGEFDVPDPSKWTDEELGIPQEDE